MSNISNSSDNSCDNNGGDDVNIKATTKKFCQESDKSDKSDIILQQTNWPEYYNPILDFWFGQNLNDSNNSNNSNCAEYRSGLWWHGIHPTNHDLRSRSDVDNYIKSKWEKLLEKYENYNNNLFENKHLLSWWMKNDGVCSIDNSLCIDNSANINGLVALMILFDQFPRHVYHGTSKEFGFDNLALQVAEYLESNCLEKMNIAYKMFMYIVFMHSENPTLVSKSTLGLLMLANSLNELNNLNKLNKLNKWKSGLKKTAVSSQEHYDILKKYGRYPHRNALLGRENTIDETDLLASKKIPMWMKPIKKSNNVTTANITTTNLTTTNLATNIKLETFDKKLKILVLHGNKQTSYLFKTKTEKYLEKKLKNIADLTYCNAPKLYKPLGLSLGKTDQLKLFLDKEYSYSSVLNTDITSSSRAWWNATDNPENMVYIGLENSIEYIESIFKNCNYDGIIGFSQGGTLAGIISAMVHNKKTGKDVPPIAIDNISKSLKFVAIISGFYCRDTRPEFSKLILEELPAEFKHSPETVKIRKDLISIPSFHIWGTTDELVSPWRSSKLAEAFDGFDGFNKKLKQIHVHPSGHFSKAIKYWPIQQMYDWLKLFAVSTNKNDNTELYDKYVTDLIELVESAESDQSDQSDQSAQSDKIKTKLNELLELSKLEDFNKELLIVQAIKSQKINTTTLFELINMICVTSENLLNILNSNVELWKYLIDLDTKYFKYLNKSDNNFRKLLSTVIAIQLKNEYQKYYVEKSSGLPSDLVKTAPKYNALYRQTRLYHDVAQSLSHILNIFDQNNMSINIEDDENLPEVDRVKRQMLLSYNQYRQVISKLTTLLNSPQQKPIEKKQHLARNNLEDLLKAPISDYILNPRPEPADISPAKLLEPLHKYLQDLNYCELNYCEELCNMEFEKGTICTDGRLDLCKQVIGPNGVSELMKSLKFDSSLVKPKVKHLLLGNNFCGNDLGIAIGEFIKSGKSALTTWYIAGNNMNKLGITPVCEAIANDNQIKQLWLKRNPLMAEGMYPIVDMMKTNTYLQVLDLTNTGILDEGAKILLNGITGIQYLKYLYLSSNGLTSKSCDILANMLHTTNLEQIGLGCNRLGDGGALHLKSALLHPLCKLKSLEISSCGIGPIGAEYISESLLVNTSLISLNMGYSKSTNDLGEVPNGIGSLGAIHLSNMLKSNTTLRFLDLVYTGIQQAGISALANVISTVNTSLIFLGVEQFGIPHNELSREVIRKSIQKNKESLSTELIDKIKLIVNPPHLEEIQSVYRIA